MRYTVPGNAGESAAGSFGGIAMFDYACTLPSAFPASAGTKYWVRIVASQGSAAPSYAPDWGFAAGTGGNNFHFRYITGGMYQNIQKDLAFSLHTAAGPTFAIDASESPAGAGLISGGGDYPVGTTATLIATPNPGWGFVRWTENGAVVSTNPHYAFTVGANRTLVAEFVSAWNIQTAAWPGYAGTTSGDGIYNDGATVTLTATANHGFVFSGWSNGDTTLTSTFPAGADEILTAFFESAPNCATFDFDGTNAGSGLPISLSVGGLGALFQGGYSVQQVGTLGIAPAGMSGHYLYPGSVFPSDLSITFTGPLTDFSILCAPWEIACDNSALLRVTAFMGATEVGTNTATAPVPGTAPAVTLAIAPPQPFDRVIIHWESAGSLCQDYAPIFFSDNVTVTRAPSGAAVDGTQASRALRLLAPSPNPSHAGAALQFDVPRAGPVRLDVYDVAGRHVRSLVHASLPAGSHRVTWDGHDDAGAHRSSGLYLVRLEAEGDSDTRRLMLVR